MKMFTIILSLWTKDPVYLTFVFRPFFPQTSAKNFLRQHQSEVHLGLNFSFYISTVSFEIQF